MYKTAHSIVSNILNRLTNNHIHCIIVSRDFIQNIFLKQLSPNFHPGCEISVFILVSSISLHIHRLSNCCFILYCGHCEC